MQLQFMLAEQRWVLKQGILEKKPGIIVFAFMPDI
jgi:hypothetical protein